MNTESRMLHKLAGSKQRAGIAPNTRDSIRVNKIINHFADRVGAPAYTVVTQHPMAQATMGANTRKSRKDRRRRAKAMRQEFAEDLRQQGLVSIPAMMPLIWIVFSDPAIWRWLLEWVFSILTANEEGN